MQAARTQKEEAKKKKLTKEAFLNDLVCGSDFIFKQNSSYALEINHSFLPHETIVNS